MACPPFPYAPTHPIVTNTRTRTASPTQLIWLPHDIAFTFYPHYGPLESVDVTVTAHSSRARLRKGGPERTMESALLPSVREPGAWRTLGVSSQGLQERAASARRRPSLATSLLASSLRPTSTRVPEAPPRPLTLPQFPALRTTPRPGPAPPQALPRLPGPRDSHAPSLFRPDQPVSLTTPLMSPPTQSGPAPPRPRPRPPCP